MRYFMTDRLRDYAISYFKSAEFNNDSANGFFETFCPGQRLFIEVNTMTGERNSISEQAYERFYDYEELLADLFNNDSEKYKDFHKGTPFFFMAWISYHMQNFDQALFYIDAAISEDSKNGKDNWTCYPAGKFLLLQKEGHTAVITVEQIIRTMDIQFKRMNKIQSTDIFNIENFIQNFVSRIISEKENRTLISSLYTFFLEYPLHLRQLDLRSSEGGTIYPFIKHLFSGGLIFETLLRLKYSKNEKGQNYSNLGKIFHDEKFQVKYGEIGSIKIDSINDVVDRITDQTLSTAFRITAMIRNTVGHNLINDDIFKEKENYIKFYEQEVNAIFYFIQNEYF